MTRVANQEVLAPLEIAFIRKYQWVVLAGITLLAFTLRFYKLGVWSLWVDEIFTINRAQNHYSNLGLALQNIPPHTNWIPISLLLISGAINALGVSEWSVRLVPAIIGVLTVPVLYLPIKKIFGITVALISSLLLVVSPWHIMWSQNGRFYVALMLFYTLALVALYFGLERNRPWYLLAGLLLFYLALSERMVAFFIVPVMAAYLALITILPFARPAGLNRKNLFILFIPVMAGLLVEGYARLAGGSSRFFDDSAAFVGNSIDNPVRILILILFSSGLPVVILGFGAGFWLVWQHSRSGLLFLLNATIPIILLVIISPWVFVVERYALITLPAWLILTAVALERLAVWLPPQGRWLSLAVLGLILADAAGAHLMYYQLNNGNRPDWRGAFAYVQAHKAPEDLVVSSRPEIGQYYLGNDQEIFSLTRTNPVELAQQNKPIWFVIDSENVWFAPDAHKQWMENNANLLFVWYLRMREQIDMKVYLYQPTKNPDE